MSNFRGREIEKISSNFTNTCSKQRFVAEGFEGQANYPMAYLAYWAVVEDFAKSLAPLCRRVELQKSIQQWSSYLLGETKSAPQKISPGKFELPKEKSMTIPEEAVLLNVLEKKKTPNLFILLSSDGKYRIRRNKIAHSAEGVSKDVYTEFKTVISTAFVEIEKWLSCS